MGLGEADVGEWDGVPEPDAVLRSKEGEPVPPHGDGVHLQEHRRVLIVVPDVGEAQFTVVTDIDGLPLKRATGGTISSRTVKDIEGAVG